MIGSPQGHFLSVCSTLRRGARALEKHEQFVHAGGARASHAAEQSLVDVYVIELGRPHLAKHLRGAGGRAGGGRMIDVM
jgi:hypothetical protein